MRTLLIHDVHGAGIVMGAILYRLYAASPEGEENDVRHQSAGHNIEEFWKSQLPGLDSEEYHRLVLVNVPVASGLEEFCIAQLVELTESNMALDVWSHRWPHSYGEHVESLVPPVDILHRFGKQMLPADRTLLQLSLIESRRIPLRTEGGSLNPSIPLANALSARVLEDGAGLVDEIMASPQAVLDQLEKQKAQFPVSGPVDEYVTVESIHRDGRVLSVRLDERAADVAEKALESVLTERDAAEGSVCVGYLSAQGSRPARLYMHRLDWRNKLPSLRWILETYAPSDGTILDVERWIGPQDALHTELSRDEDADSPELLGRVIDWVDGHGWLEEGRRYPAANLIKVMTEAIEQSIRDLDLTGAHSGNLRVDPNRMTLLFHRGLKSNEMRETICVQILATTMDALAFMYRDAGYNLIKLERRLEGILTGFALLAGLALEGLAIPSRLRVDIEHEDLNARTASEFTTAMATDSVIDMTITRAKQASILQPRSAIEEATSTFGITSLVVLSESEMIGPSVPFAIACQELAMEIARNSKMESRSRTEESGQPFRLRVLDLFAGSGASARAILRNVPNALVYSVDKMIPGEVGRSDVASHVWLRLSADEQLWNIIDGRFDLVAMDPPHAQVPELLFGRSDRSFLTQCQDRCPYIVLYIGHETQRGRLDLSLQGLSDAGYTHQRVLQIGHEIVILGRTSRIESDEGARVGLDQVVDRIEVAAQQFNWVMDEIK